MLVLFFADTAVQENTKLLYQQMCMERVLCSDEPLSIPALCGMEFIRCNAKSEIISMQWTEYREPWALEWLPPSLGFLSLRSQPLFQHLNTRNLPRGLYTINFEFCGIYGTVDLTALPPALELLYLNRNAIRGTVSLLRLPQRLEHINLSLNRISVVFVSNELLPKTLEAIYLRPHKRKRRIHCISLDGTEVDERIVVQAATT